LLAESLEVIQQTSAVILAVLQEPSPEESHGQPGDTAPQPAVEEQEPVAEVA